jgi:hypothetical protein
VTGTKASVSNLRSALRDLEQYLKELEKPRK